LTGVSAKGAPPVKRLFVLAALLAASAACGGHDSPAAPTAPSATAETRVIALSGRDRRGPRTIPT
jgi:hypothetical protein